MKRQDLRNEFLFEEELNWENSQGEPEIDYVLWLENRLLSKEPTIDDVFQEEEEKELRYFVDIRSGCAAVRDKQHPDYDPEYPGLHHDTLDVVEYRHGFQDHENNCWDMKQEDIDSLIRKCQKLNKQSKTKNRITNSNPP